MDETEVVFEASTPFEAEAVAARLVAAGFDARAVTTSDLGIGFPGAADGRAVVVVTRPRADEARVLIATTVSDDHEDEPGRSRPRRPWPAMIALVVALLALLSGVVAAVLWLIPS